MFFFMLDHVLVACVLDRSKVRLAVQGSGSYFLESSEQELQTWDSFHPHKQRLEHRCWAMFHSC